MIRFPSTATFRSSTTSSRGARLARYGVALVGLTLGACMGQEGASTVGLAGTSIHAVRYSPGEAVTNSALGDYLAGNFALGVGELDQAALYFESALSDDPENLDLLRQVFLLTLASGQYDQALEQARRLDASGLDAEEARLFLALTEVRAGEFDQARSTLADIATDGLAALAVPFLDAWARFGEGDDEAAARAIERLDAAESLGPLNDYHGAMLLDLGGRDREAMELLASAMPENGRAPVRMVQAYANLLARDGKRHEAITLLQGQLADGRDQPVLENALATLEDGAVPDRPFTDPAGGMADALLGLAEALHQERGGPRAVAYARLASYLRPELAEANLLIGDIMAEQENYDAATQAYEAVPESSPLDYAARLRTARALYNLEQKEEAYDLLDRLAAANPGRTEALVQLGDLLRRDEAYDEAEQAYSRALERLDGRAREHWTLLYARGITYERTDRWSEAESDFLEALELEPEQPFVLNYLGYSWVDQGMRLDEAKEMLNRAVELRPNDGYIVDSLGWVHYRLGDYGTAVEQLERAVELEPGDPIINDHLGDAYWRVGREREARFQWQRALSLEPEDDEIAQIEQKLRSGLPAKNEDGVGRS